MTAMDGRPVVGWAALLLVLPGCFSSVNLGGGDDDGSLEGEGTAEAAEDGGDALDADDARDVTGDAEADGGEDGAEIVPPVCGNGVVESGEDCEAGPPQPCTTTCGPLGTHACLPDCRWGPCAGAGEEPLACNGIDDDCDGVTDEGLWCVAVPSGDWTLYGIWGSSDHDIWAVGEGGAVLHRDATSWAPVFSDTTYPLRSVWGTGPSDVWAVGAGGATIHWDGSSWASVSIGTTFDLYGVWCAGGDAWIVGYQGTIRRRQDGSWSEMPSGVRDYYDLYALAGESVFDVTTRVWVVGEMGTVLRWTDGAGWSDLSIETPETLRAIHLLSDDDGWVVGDGGTAFHWDGSGWSITPLGTTQDMTAVWGLSASDVWATGGEPLEHWDGTSWEILWFEPGPGPEPRWMNLFDIWGWPPGELWAVGDGGLVLHYRE